MLQHSFLSLHLWAKMHFVTALCKGEEGRRGTDLQLDQQYHAHVMRQMPVLLFLTSNARRISARRSVFVMEGRMLLQGWLTAASMLM